MNPTCHSESLSTYYRRYFQIIIRINKFGATEKQRYFLGELPSHLKEAGWKPEVKKGKRLFKRSKNG